MDFDIKKCPKEKALMMTKIKNINSLIEYTEYLDNLSQTIRGLTAMREVLMTPESVTQQAHQFAKKKNRAFEDYIQAEIKNADSQKLVLQTLTNVLADILFKAGEEDAMPKSTPLSISAKILKAARHLAANPQQITDCPTQLKENLNCEKHALYELYRMLQSASTKAMEAAKNNRDEDGITNVFLNEFGRLTNLAQLADIAPALTAIIYPLMTNLNTGVVETDVGSDFAMIIAGEDMLGEAGAKVFWIQAKRALGSNFSIDVSRKSEKNCQFRQISTLIAMDSEDGRSTSMHLQFGRSSVDLDFPWSFRTFDAAKQEENRSFSSLTCIPPVENKNCFQHDVVPTQWNFEDHACRFAEHILLCLAEGGEVFCSAEQFLDFFERHPRVEEITLPPYLVLLYPTRDIHALNFAKEIAENLKNKPNWRPPLTRALKHK